MGLTHAVIYRSTAAHACNGELGLDKLDVPSISEVGDDVASHGAVNVARVVGSWARLVPRVPRLVQEASLAGGPLGGSRVPVQQS
jgi:hypothetical protein